MSIYNKNKLINKTLIKILNGLSHCIPARLFVSLKYYLVFGHWPNLDDPQSYNEKLQWLKLYFHDDRLTEYVDKILVKEYVSATIGSEYVIPTLACYDSVDEIDFSKLPDKFVIKCNHNSGGLTICKDKNLLDFNECKKKLKDSLKQNYYWLGREWPYKNVKPRILVETLLETDSDDLSDYKFYCFDGKPMYMLISHGRSTVQTSFDYYDMDFNLLPFRQGGPNSGISDDKPDNFELMKELAGKLSVGLPHVRVDLYNCHGKVYFGELTFFDSNGFAEFEPMEWDMIFGKQITLPSIEKK